MHEAEDGHFHLAGNSRHADGLAIFVVDWHVQSIDKAQCESDKGPGALSLAYKGVEEPFAQCAFDIASLDRKLHRFRQAQHKNRRCETRSGLQFPSYLPSLTSCIRRGYSGILDFVGKQDLTRHARAGLRHHTIGRAAAPPVACPNETPLLLNGPRVDARADIGLDSAHGPSPECGQQACGHSLDAGRTPNRQVAQVLQH